MTLAAAFAVTIGTIGAWLVFSGHPLTRDEDMATFDAAILSSGHLIASIAPQWRTFASALEPEFVAIFGDGAAWSAAYLPGNAFIRALFSLAHAEVLTGPALAGLATVSAFGAARKLWPTRFDAAIVAAVLVCSSSQVLLTAMTPYAMTAHLALNSLWLWLFLIDRRCSHAAAMLIGLLAAGLHQILFHPMFVAPFVVMLGVQKRWRLAVAYAAAYAAIGLFWIAYRPMVLQFAGLPTVSTEASLTTRIVLLLSNFDVAGLNTMLKNLVRFATWQNPIMLPLVAAALLSWRHLEAPLKALLASAALTFLAMCVLLPYQGHGWGYRYLHGFIGGFALLAAHGWIVLTADATLPTRRAFVLSTGLAVFALLPIRAVQAHLFASPYARAATIISKTDADVVAVDTRRITFAVDLVRNDPFLRNRPLIFDLSMLKPEQIDSLCATHTVAIFDVTAANVAGIPTYDSDADEDARIGPLRARLTDNACGTALASGR